MRGREEEGVEMCFKHVVGDLGKCSATRFSQRCERWLSIYGRPWHEAEVWWSALMGRHSDPED